MEGIIYKIENKENGMVYIGQTINEESRYKDHFNVTRKATGFIDQCIRKHGADMFIYEVVERYSDDSPYNLKKILNEREIALIEQYDCIFPKGYNFNSGGNSNIPCEAARKKISDANKGENNYWYGKTIPDSIKQRIFSTFEDKGINKPVVQLSKDGEYITEYWGIREASRALKGNDGYASNIRNVINGKKPSMYGFKFMWKEDYLKMIENQDDIQ